jgi:uncharacterized protein YacL
MTKAKARRSNARTDRSRVHPRDQEVDSLVLAWTMAVITGLLCELAAAAAAWLGGHVERLARFDLLPGLLLFAALVMGLIILALTPFVLRLSRVAPPPPVLTFGLIVGIVPFVILAVRAWQMRAL